MQPAAIITTDLPFPLFRRGKVRDVYDLGSFLLLVSTDRISAFDHIMPTPIPNKGAVLTQISDFWFRKTASLIRNHMLTANPADFPAELAPYSELLGGRAMVVAKTEPIDVECVVRGYLAGSAWTEYQRFGTVSGISLSPGMMQSQRLETPIFSPAIKNHNGHDENITFETMCGLIGEKTAMELKEKSMALYEEAQRHVEKKGLILADTKFEFGRLNNAILVIDELLTPDSSRYWAEADYRVGISPNSFDKQILRDYLEGIGWDKESNAPHLPEEIVDKISQRYIEGFECITGRRFI
ncbi:phosphoribosylaminoimidazolesuccinocarboxamide synthase [bacterium]|nr:phosphoribosylaminoimidazolesuccinocarboxamide synthase [bacterium]